MFKYLRKIAIPLLLIFWVATPISAVFAQTPVVHAVLFFSPSCTHCHEVMEKHLPPLVDKYPGQLDIVGINIEEPVGSDLYQTMLTVYDVPDDRIGVPTLVVGDVVLVGSGEIPELFPGIIERGLSAGGISWPEIPGLDSVLAAQPSDPGAGAASAPVPELLQLTPWQKFLLEPVENSLAVAILILMVASVILVAFSYIQNRDSRLFNWHPAAVPTLSVIGVGIAAYLSYTYLTNTEVICGPSGGCANVQNSPYAYLFGLIPVGLFGLAGYIAILIAWIVYQSGPERFRKSAAVSMWGFTWFGIIFTIYLTFLEPFVIGASCLWCLGSAVVMNCLFLASTGPAIKLFGVEPVDGDEEDDLDDEPTSA